MLTSGLQQSHLSLWSRMEKIRCRTSISSSFMFIPYSSDVFGMACLPFFRLPEAAKWHVRQTKIISGCYNVALICHLVFNPTNNSLYSIIETISSQSTAALQLRRAKHTLLKRHWTQRPRACSRLCHSEDISDLKIDEYGRLQPLSASSTTGKRRGSL